MCNKTSIFFWTHKYACQLKYAGIKYKAEVVTKTSFYFCTTCRYSPFHVTKTYFKKFVHIFVWRRESKRCPRSFVSLYSSSFLSFRLPLISLDMFIVLTTPELVRGVCPNSTAEWEHGEIRKLKHLIWILFLQYYMQGTRVEQAFDIMHMV